MTNWGTAELGLCHSGGLRVVEEPLKRICAEGRDKGLHLRPRRRRQHQERLVRCDAMRRRSRSKSVFGAGTVAEISSLTVPPTQFESTFRTMEHVWTLQPDTNRLSTFTGAKPFGGLRRSMEDGDHRLRAWRGIH